jgi:hypothetical protein
MDGDAEQAAASLLGFTQYYFINPNRPETVSTIYKDRLIATYKAGAELAYPNPYLLCSITVAACLPELFTALPLEEYEYTAIRLSRSKATRVDSYHKACTGEGSSTTVQQVTEYIEACDVNTDNLVAEFQQLGLPVININVSNLQGEGKNDTLRSIASNIKLREPDDNDLAIIDPTKLSQ